MAVYIRCIVVVVLAAVPIVIGAGGSASWAYEGRNNPYTWFHNYPDCAKFSQSPIDVPEGVCSSHGHYYHEESEEDGEGFEISGLDDKMTVTVVNNGHSIQANMPKDSDVHFHINGKTYVVGLFHFHWGKPGSGKGSEHTLGRNSFPLELHIVGYDKQYKGIGDAADKRGLAVLGFMFLEGESNDFLEELADKDLGKKSSNTVEGFRFSDLVSTSVLENGYYRYSGSLTTPPCYEGVTWTLFRFALTVSDEQLSRFREKTGITHNYRPVQPLVGRKISCH